MTVVPDHPQDPDHRIMPYGLLANTVFDARTRAGAWQRSSKKLGREPLFRIWQRQGSTDVAPDATLPQGSTFRALRLLLHARERNEAQAGLMRIQSVNFSLSVLAWFAACAAANAIGQPETDLAPAAADELELLPPAPSSEAAPPPPPGSDQLPSVLGSDWWANEVSRAQRPQCRLLALTLHELAIETVTHSQQIQALRVAPEIRRTQVVQADAEFDPLAFVDAKWFDRDEPVGNFLATGGADRLLEDTFTQNIGVRRKARTGASLELAQRMGTQDSNSTFFIPRNQAQSRLALSVTQPLMRGAGRAFNESIVVLAQHDVRVAYDDFVEGLQDRLLRVAQQYWQLYLRRSLVLQQSRNLKRARAIQTELESRQTIDALRSQIERAKAKVATREAALLRAQAGVRDAEATLRALVNSPRLSDCRCLEISPLDTPREDYFTLGLCQARQVALARRPEIDNILTQIRAASVRLNVACNQVLPSLALVVETYVNGLQGDKRLGEALGDQFSRGAPSYSAGLFFEMPIGNRRAKAQLRQRQLELTRFYRELDAAMAELAAEVEIALREVDVTHAELQSRRTSLAATAAEVEYLYQRWRRLPGHDQSASLFLEDLLDAEDRLVAEEQRVAEAQTSFAVAQVELKRALGELVVSAPCEVCQSGPVGAPTPAIETPAAEPVNSIFTAPEPPEDLQALPPIEATAPIASGPAPSPSQALFDAPTSRR